MDGILPLIREISSLRWEHAAPQRVGCRMGRPEKSAPERCHHAPHAVPDCARRWESTPYLNAQARVRFASKWEAHLFQMWKGFSFIQCHHRVVDDAGIPKVGETCGGRTDMKESTGNSRRRGEMQSVPLESIIEDAQLRIGMGRLPSQVKCVKELKSRNQTPEPIEKVSFEPNTTFLCSVMVPFDST